MFGLPKIPWGFLGVAGGTDTRPTNSQEDMSALAKLYRETRAKNGTPNGRVARGFDQFGPQGGLPPQPTYQQGSDPVTAGNTPAPYAQAEDPMGAPALYAAKAVPPVAAPAVTTPMPPAVPATPQDPMGFFQRNAAMMRDPSSGDFIDPENAARAQASGPDVIQKLLNMFHQKA